MSYLLSDNIFNKYSTLDELFKSDSFPNNQGYYIFENEKEKINHYKNSFKNFKKYIKKEIPNCSIEEVLRFWKLKEKMKKITEFNNHRYLIYALDYELRKKNDTK